MKTILKACTFAAASMAASLVAPAAHAAPGDYFEFVSKRAPLYEFEYANSLFSASASGVIEGHTWHNGTQGGQLSNGAEGKIQLTYTVLGGNSTIIFTAQTSAEEEHNLTTAGTRLDHRQAFGQVFLMGTNLYRATPYGGARASVAFGSPVFSRTFETIREDYTVGPFDVPLVAEVVGTIRGGLNASAGPGSFGPATTASVLADVDLTARIRVGVGLADVAEAWVQGEVDLFDLDFRPNALSGYTPWNGGREARQAISLRAPLSLSMLQGDVTVGVRALGAQYSKTLLDWPGVGYTTNLATVDYVEAFSTRQPSTPAPVMVLRPL